MSYNFGDKIINFIYLFIYLDTCGKGTYFIFPGCSLNVNVIFLNALHAHGTIYSWPTL